MPVRSRPHAAAENHLSAAGDNSAQGDTREQLAAWLAIPQEELGSLSEQSVQALTAMVETMREIVPEVFADLRGEVKHLSELARTDPLTGIANRRALDERLHEEFDRARRYGRSLAVILLDVDHLKELNDRLGHAAGDELLKTVCCRISGVLRSGDFFARAGGDEFVVLCPEASPEAAAEVAARVVREAAGAMLPQWSDVSPSLSAGWAALDGELNADDMMRAADVALYRAKLTGRGRSYGPGASRPEGETPQAQQQQ